MFRLRYTLKDGQEVQPLHGTKYAAPGTVIDLTPDIQPNYDFYKTGPGYNARRLVRKVVCSASWSGSSAIRSFLSPRRIDLTLRRRGRALASPAIGVIIFQHFRSR